MARVFVSHASHDRDLAVEVSGWLIDDGHELFFDQHLQAGLAIGEQTEPRLFERLRWADAVVSLVTSAYVASPWCTAELTTAMNRGSRVLPLIAEAGVSHPLLTGIRPGDHSGDPAAARAALREALRQLDTAGGRGWADGRSPFPGLRAFDTDMHRAFFGRHGEAAKLAELLRSPLERADRGVLVVTGPSGCGKSSLVRAGLLPLMAGEPGWETLPVMLPGADPIGALTREITSRARGLGLAWELPQVRSRLDGDHPGGVMEELLLAVHPGGRRLLIVIDQFEELLTLTGSADRARFAGVLRRVLDGPAQVVGTLRPEFLAPVLANPELTGVTIRTFLLRPLPPESLRRVIEGPAELAGIDVDPELVTRLVTDTGAGDALPLLAFTLQQLAADVTRGGHLSLRRYEQLGGVRGALTSQADAALTDAVTATGRTPGQVINGMLGLVTVDQLDRPTRNRVPLTELPEIVRTELAEFDSRRLVTIDTEDSVVVIGVAHEAFLTAWSPLTQAITEHGVAIRTRRSVEQAAIEWDGTGRDRKRLWERGQLWAAVNDLDDPTRSQRPDVGADKSDVRLTARRWLLPRRQLEATKVQLSTRARDFLRASIRTDRRRRTRATTILSLLLIAALTAATIAYTQQRSAEELQRVATARQLLAQADVIGGSDPRTAVNLLLASSRLHPDPQTDATLINHVVGSHLESTLTGHTDAVYAVAFSPDGHTLATGSTDTTVILWDVTDPTRPSQIGPPLTGHSRGATSVAFSPDGRTLATGSFDTTVILWDVTDPTRPSPIGPPLTGHTDTVFSLAFSPDGRTLATGSTDSTVILWDVTDRARPSPIGPPLTGHTDTVFSAVFSPDGRTLATGSNDSTVILWDVTDRARPSPIGPPLTGHTDRVFSAVFSPDGRTLATGSADQTVILWDVTDRTRPSPIGPPLTGHTDTVFSVVFSPDGRTLATGSADQTVILWDVTDRTRPSPIGPPLTGHTDRVFTAVFSPDGRTLATGSTDSTVILWDVTDRTRPSPIGPPLAGHTDTVYAVAFSPDGRTLATGSNDTTVILWDVTDRTRPSPTGTPLPGQSTAVQSVAFSPDGRILATGSADTTVILWDVTDRTRPSPIGPPLAGHTDTVFTVVFSPDGRTLATGSNDTTVILWDVTDRARPSPIGPPLTGHTDAVYAVAFSPDGRTLATGSADTSVILWDVTDRARPSPTGPPLTGQSNAVQSVAFSPDGRTLATGSNDKTVILWDVTDRTRPSPIGPPLTGHTDRVYAVAFSPDGRTLATGSNDKTVILWDVTDRTRPSPIGPPLTGHTDTVYAVVFSPDGRTLATGSNDKTVILWDVTGMTELRDHLVERACLITGQGLTPDEWAHYIPDLPYQDACAP